MTILNQLNSAPMYLICGSIIAFVAVVCVIFLIRAYQAGKALGMDETKMKLNHYFKCNLFGTAEYWNFAGSHCTFRKSGNTVAVASSFRDWSASL